ncbi:MAG: AAA family ATPase [Planctomycetota bacterium]|nr:AAA family ATPase [Planctomycetota bacterium]
MIRTQPSHVMKYVEGLDTFLTFRVFSNNEEIQNLLRKFHITSRRSYVQAVVRACVLKLPRELQGKAEGMDAERRRNMEEHIYDVCVSLNPALDINRVVLPAEAPAGEEERKVSRKSEPDAGKEPDLSNLEARLRERIIGQDAAVRAVSRAVRRAYAGIRDPNRPIGVFLFLGQTGVGKTETAKALAEAISGDSREMVRIDCSEYSLPHEYAKLIGAPPGYVGHEHGGYLSSVMSEVHGGVVLFDEIEKADERVHNLLLQIMDEGFVTDAKGTRIDFTDTIIILTSNIGAAETEQLRQRIGFGTGGEAVVSHEERTAATIEATRKRFKPEFLNRIDETIVFRSLDRQDAGRILDKFIGDLESRLKRIGAGIRISRAARKLLLEKGFSTDFGARELRRAVRNCIEAPLSELLLGGKDASCGYETGTGRASRAPARNRTRRFAAGVRGGKIRIIEENNRSAEAAGSVEAAHQGGNSSPLPAQRPVPSPEPEPVGA